MTTSSFPLHYFTFWSASVTALFVSLFSMDDAFVNTDMRPTVRVVRALVDTSASLFLLQSLFLLCVDVHFSRYADEYFSERSFYPETSVIATAALTLVATILFGVHASFPADKR